MNTVLVDFFIPKKGDCKGLAVAQIYGEYMFPVQLRHAHLFVELHIFYHLLFLGFKLLDVSVFMKVF